MKSIYIKVTDNQKSVIVEKAKKAGATITDFILSKALGIPLVEKPEVIEYVTKKYRTKGPTRKLKEV